MAEDRVLQYDPSTDYYRVLGVPPSASIAEINRVYRQRAKQVHPDLNPTRQAWAKQQFQQINAAHDVLSDPERRTQYDNLRLAYYSQAFSGPSASQINAQRAAAQQPIYRARTTYTSPSKRQMTPVLSVLFWISILLLIFARTVMPQSSDDVPNFGPTLSMEQPYQPATCTNDPNVQITAPKDGSSISRMLVVRGTAAGPNFQSYTVQVTTSITPSYIMPWQTLANSKSPITDNYTLGASNLADFNALPYYLHIVRLTVNRTDGTSEMCDVSFFIADTSRGTPTTM